MFELRRAVLGHLRDLGDGSFGWCAYNFRAFKDLALPRAVLGAVLRDCRDLGLVTFERGLWSEDGLPAGSGYRLTDSGRRWLADLEETT